MKFLSKSKDGGPESTVDAYWLLEVKGLLSVALLKFGPGSRPSFHSHAFHSLNWLLRGRTREQRLDPATSTVTEVNREPSLRPIVTYRSTFHRVVSAGTSWVFSIRGPWQSHWLEYDRGKYKVLEHGRGVIAEGFSPEDAAWLLWLAPRDIKQRAENLP